MTERTERLTDEARHSLKIDVQPMDDLMFGAKTGEVRNDDRGFSVGDWVDLTCKDGRCASFQIGHIQRGYGLPDGLCVLSYRRATPADDLRAAVLAEAIAAVDSVDVSEPCGATAINDALRRIRALAQKDRTSDRPD